MRVLWALNGWGQSAGWALMVQTLSDWNTSARRGTLIGRLSTSYQVGHVLSWPLAGVLCEHVCWRAAFVVPALFLMPMALIRFAFLRDSPVEAGFAPVRDDVAFPPQAPGSLERAPSANSDWGSTLHVLWLTLSNRVLWILTLCFFVMNAVRYSFMNWSVQYMAEFTGAASRTAC